MKTFVLVAALLGLSACGATQKLKPQDGVSLPPKAIADRAVPTPEQLIVADDQARPRRTDEVLKRSEKRRPDSFDLPPPG